VNITVTGDTSNQLGFGTFVGNAAAPDYTTLTGNTYTTNAGNKYGTADLEFSINGAASNANQVSVDLSGGDATAATATSTALTNTGATTLTIAMDGGAAMDTLSLTNGETALQIAAQINADATGGVNTSVSASVDAGGHLVVTSLAAGGHALTLGGTNTLNINGTTYGNARSGQSVADTLNSQFAANATLAAAGMKAPFAGNQLTISSDNNTYFRMNAGGTAAKADIGFGAGAASGTAGYTGPASSSAVNAFMADAQGTTQSKALAFSSLAYGGDSQAVTVSAKDASGTLQSTTITLQNVGGASATRVGGNIDSAIAYINQQLQSSNNSTLQQIVAVKEDVSGTQKINFLSSLTGFSVAVGATANSDGFTSAAGTTVAATANGTGGSLAVDTQAGAAQAVSAISTAITLLGTAQGAVGQSQNQLNYAINLAQFVVLTEDQLYYLPLDRSELDTFTKMAAVIAERVQGSPRRAILEESLGRHGQPHLGPRLEGRGAGQPKQNRARGPGRVRFPLTTRCTVGSLTCAVRAISRARKPGRVCM